VTPDYVTRTEFNSLAATVTTQGKRIDWLDEHGTRGVGALQLQVTELAKDVAKVEASQEQHVIMHQSEASERQSSRRWLVASVLIPTFAVMVALGTLVVLLRNH
jgi:hypothetical protein